MNDEGHHLSDAAIADHMNFLIMAAHDTITSSATSLVMLLGRNPDWQDKLRTDILALGADPERQLDKLVLTDMAFKEALRLLPPVPSLPRRALRDFSFGGYDIPVGTTVGITVSHTHRMP